MNFPHEDAMKVANSLHRVEKALKTHHAMLTRMARKHGATNNDVQAFSGGTNKQDDPE